MKVRGFRIELGEIEALLRECAGVRQVVVVARSNGGSDKRLVAYLTVAREQAPTPDQLRHYLKDRLPEYMIPAAFVLLDKLPLNANGKIDRQALPAPEQVCAKTYVPPRTPTEQVVATIWAEVLRCGPVSIEDNFFDLGGHSLLATQVTSRLRRTFEVKLPLRSIFESPTVTGTADQIEKVRRTAQGLQPPRLERVSRDNPLPLSFAQQRLWFLDQLEPNNPLYNITRAVRIIGDLDLAVLERSLNEIVRRHESQRTIFKTVGGRPFQFILPELNLKIPLTDLGDVPENTREEAARKILTEESQQTFNLETGPLLRGRVLRLKRCEHLLALSMHHIVSDAWSAGILFQELGTLYRAFSERKPSPLADLPIQYADYAMWQRRWLQGKVLEKQMAHWRKQLEGAPRLLELPTDRPRPAIRSFLGSYETVSIPAEIVRAIHELSRRQRSTLFMTLLAAFQTLLWKCTGQDQVVVGTDVANRTREETEKLIGFFINLLALRTDLSGDPSFNDLLERVRQVTLAGYDHQDFPFEKLVEELQPERNLSHNPLVQVLFVMQNIPRVARELGALKLSPVDLEITRSKFDLGVFMADREDELVGYWLYSTELFDGSTIRSMAAHYETLLSNIVANADARISTLEYLSEAEQLRKSTAQQERKQSQLKKLLKLEAKVVDL